MLRNAKIGVKLSVGFGVLIVTMIVISAITISAFISIENDKNEMVDHNLFILINTNGVIDELNIMQRSYLRIALAENDDEVRTQRQRANQSLQTAGGMIEAITPRISANGEERTTFDANEAHKIEFLKVKTHIDNLLDEKAPKEVIVERIMHEFVPVAAGFIDTISNFITYQERAINETADGISREISTSKNTVIIAFVIGLVIALIFAYTITKMITTPVSQCLQVANSLANGDTNIEINVDSSDETGQLKKAMKGMVTAIQNMYTDCVYLSESATAGKMQTRIDTTHHKNDFAKLIAGINSVLEAVCYPMKETMEVMDKLAHKDLTARITTKYPGDFEALMNNINLAAANIEDSLIQVDMAVEQISAAAGEISSGSQSLAESTSEQASSIEEISASLNEINSLTGSNADNARAGQRLAEQAVQAVDSGNMAMEKMNKAMEAILKSSQETGKIIKTIDEIAFQTNLLALNAAVEAAHAGDAGKGFAVVAEEVKNLALRSAEAAKDTNVLIDEAGHNSEIGSNIAEQVSKSFTEMKQQFNKVKSIVGEISASSDEQANGVRQISDGVAEMNKVTQQNAANSEESASASEQLTSQAAELKGMVGSFTLSSQNKNAFVPKKPTMSHVDKRMQRQLPYSKPKGYEVKPEAVLPLESLEDDDFHDFN